MSIQQLFDILLQFEPLPRSLLNTLFMNEMQEHLKPLLIRQEFRKNQILISTGHHVNHIFFLEEGILRGYYPNATRKREFTHYLWSGRSCIADPECLFLEKPATLTIETLTPSVLFSISLTNLAESIEKYEVLELFTRNILLHAYFHEKQRNIELLTLSAWERYLSLLNQQPFIERYVSKEIIASYLNITPQSLSRLLKEKGHP